MGVGCIPEGFTSNLAEVLEGGGGSNLGEIELFCNSVEDEREFARVLCEGACPKLYYLYVYVVARGDSCRRYISELRTLLSGRGIKLTNFGGGI